MILKIILTILRSMGVMTYQSIKLIVKTIEGPDKSYKKEKRKYM